MTSGSEPGWTEQEAEVYRELRALLEERSPDARQEEREKLDDVRSVVARMEADLAPTMDALEELRGETVFDPERYVQEFTYAGTRIEVRNQSSRLIVDMADEDALGEPQGVTMEALRQCNSALLRIEYDMSLGGYYRKAVTLLTRNGCVDRSAVPGEDTVERDIDAVLTEAGYTQAYLYGNVEQRLDDALDLARTPLEERPVERERYTVRTGGATMRSGRIEVQGGNSA